MHPLAAGMGEATQYWVELSVVLRYPWLGFKWRPHGDCQPLYIGCGYLLWGSHWPPSSSTSAPFWKMEAFPLSVP